MDITTLTSSDLRKIEALLKSKEKLLAQVEEINAALRAFSGEPAPSGKRAYRRSTGSPKAPRGKRGAIKEKIIAELQAAGKNGLHMKDLASKLGVKVTNLSVWFFSTGKKIKEIKKLAPATYGWNG